MSNIYEMLKNEKVEWKKIGEIKEIRVISPKKKLKKQEYLDEGTYPIIDQGQNFIVGYTDDSSAVFDEFSYVIFGDHTESVKYADFKFAQGADGIKVLKTDEQYINSRYLYHSILGFYKMTGKYMRHFSILKETEIPIPSLETQEKIAKTLDKFTNYVTELQAELQAELQNRHKQYEYYRNKLLSEEYLNKLSEKLDKIEYKNYELVNVELEKIIKIKNGKDWKQQKKGSIPVYGSGGKMGVFVENYIYNKPTVLIPRKGSIENIFYVEEPFWNVDTIFYTEIDETYIIPKFFYYFMENYNIISLSTDATRPSLTQYTLNKINIILPPKEIQNKVVEILDKFQLLLEDTKGLLPEEISQRQKQYEYYREKLLNFEEFGTEIAINQSINQSILRLNDKYFELLYEASKLVGVKLGDTVEWKNLGDIGIFENGTGMPKSLFDENGDIGAIHYGHIYTRYNLFLEKPIAKLKSESANNLRKVNKGDLVIARTSENIDDVMKTIAYIGDKQCVTGGHSAIFRHNENPKYLSYVFNGANYLIKQKNKFAKGVKVIELSTTDMEKIQIPLPSLAVQEHIVSILDKFDALINDISQGLPKEIDLRQKQYEYYREKLLSFNKNN